MITKKNLFPNLVDEGKKYGLSETQISQLVRYLNDKKMLRLISLESFNQNARAWLSALTGIVASVLAADAHIAIWLDKKMEKPRNWVLSKLSNVIPTQIDDMAVKAIQVASDIRDNKILPLKENILSKIASKMHDKYDKHVNTTYLGNSLKDLKNIAKTILKDSKAQAKKDALKMLKDRKFETHILGGYHDDSGNFVKLSKYNQRASYRAITNNVQKGKDNIGSKQTNQEEREIP